jgi:hypothetical protein
MSSFPNISNREAWMAFLAERRSFSVQFLTTMFDYVLLWQRSSVFHHFYVEGAHCPSTDRAGDRIPNGQQQRQRVHLHLSHADVELREDDF